MVSKLCLTAYQQAALQSEMTAQQTEVVAVQKEVAAVDDHLVQVTLPSLHCLRTTYNFRLLGKRHLP